MDAWLYWLMFSGLAAASFVRPRLGLWDSVLITVVLVAIVGFRHEIGPDWGTYLSWQQELRGAELWSAFSRYPDPAYTLLNWLGANGLGGIYFVNLICAVLGVVPLVLFCRAQRNPPLALMVAIPYLLTVGYMGFTRQGAATGLGMLAMLAVLQKRTWLFVASVTLAAMFHKAAVLLFALSPAMYANNPDWRAVRNLAVMAVYAVALTALLAWQEAASLLRLYVVRTGDSPFSSLGGLTPPRNSGLYSAGAIPRLLQSLVAAAAFGVIFFRNRPGPRESAMWAIVSALAVALFVLAFWRSTLADRIGLFFTPLQIYAFSHLPGVFRQPLSRLVHLAIITCSAAVFYIWLNYSSDAQAWVPYRWIISYWLAPSAAAP